MVDKIDKILGSPRLRLPPALRTIFALMLREMATTYGRSPGGYLWAIAEPVAGIALLAFVFSLGFHAPPLGSSFSLFYASGLLPFLIYSEINGKLSQAINFSRPLLSYPMVTFADAVLARALLNAATQAIVALCVLVGVLVFFDLHARIDVVKIAQAIFCSCALGVGLGTLNCFLVTRFPVWQRVWSIANRPMFLMSCIVFTFETVPMPFRDLLWFNPVVHAVGMMRQGLYFGYDGAHVSLRYVLFVALASMLAGLFLMWRYRDQMLNP